MFLSFNSFSLIVTSFNLSIPGNEVLNKSPAIIIKLTLFSIDRSIALMKASVLILFSLGSRHEPM